MHVPHPRVIVVGDCWEWTGSVDKTGYGMVHGVLPDGMVRAHRLAFQLFYGHIPEGLVIDHLCHNRRCLNPAHLEAVTVAENNRRSPAHSATHCIRGHPLSGDNLLVNKRGWKNCKECGRMHARLFSDAQNAAPRRLRDAGYYQDNLSLNAGRD